MSTPHSSRGATFLIHAAAEGDQVVRSPDADLADGQFTYEAARNVVDP